MRIFQINASYKPAYIYGGPTMSVSKLCEGLAISGQDVEVLTTLANGKQEFPYPAGKITLIDRVPVRFFKRISKDHTHFSPALLRYLNKIITHDTNLSNFHESINDRRKTKDKVTIKKSHELHEFINDRRETKDESKQINQSTKKSIIHIHAWWNLVSVFASLIAIRKTKTVILSPHGTLSHYSFYNRSFWFKNIFHLLIGKWLLKHCHFHVTTEKEKEDILRLLNPKSIQVIPNFVQLPSGWKPPGFAEGGFKHPELFPPDDALKLLFLSRIEEKKGLDILFKALAQLDIPYHLNIAGTGAQSYISALKKLADRLNISHQISWIGLQNYKEKFRVIQHHHLLILPSHDENFANVVIESLAMGTAVLLSEKVGLAQYVKETNLGWVSPLHPDAFCKHLESIFYQKEQLQTIRLKAPEKIRTDFNNQKLLEAYLQFYQQIIEYE